MGPASLLAYFIDLFIYIGILKSNVGFDYEKRLEDCHCEGKARSNLQPATLRLLRRSAPRSDMIGLPAYGPEV